MVKKSKFNLAVFWLAVIAVAFSQVSCSESLGFLKNTASPGPKVKNIILLIGDGMGPNHVSLARHRFSGQGGKLHMEKLPVTGLVKTYSADSIVTDSAAAGTAMACGVKTDNGMVGMNPDKVRYNSIMELLDEKGWRTGLVATSEITHATPASFASHVSSRHNQDEIAKQMFGNRVDVIFGGGRKFWLPKGFDKGARKDGLNLIKSAESYGYQTALSRKEFFEIHQMPAVGLFADGGLENTDSEPTIAEMTEKAIELLDAGNKNGFFLVIEGSQIDWASQANDLEDMLVQLRAFDLAVKEALDFARGDGNTLVIVTADHEAGGLVIKESLKGAASAKWTSKHHTAADVPLYAYGPGAEEFAGVLDNTEIPAIIARLVGIDEFPVAVGTEKSVSLEVIGGI